MYSIIFLTLKELEQGGGRIVVSDVDERSREPEGAEVSRILALRLYPLLERRCVVRSAGKGVERKTERAAALLDVPEGLLADNF